MGGEWTQVAFSKLCDITRGASPRPINDWFADVGIPWVKISDANSAQSRYITKTGQYIKPEGRKKSVEVRPGDLILSNSATPGIPKFMGINACIHDGWLLLRNLRNLDKQFAYYLLLHERPKLVAQGNGSVFTNLKTEILKNHLVQLPPISEQRAIAHILGTLDDKIELNRRRNQTLEAMARALFKDWFVDFGPVRAKMEGREPYLPADLWQRFPDRLDDEGKPEAWEMQPLSELLTIIGGGTPKTSAAEYWGGDIPWFSVVDTPPASDVFVVATEKNITAQGLAGSSARLIPKGTTIISARGTVGNLAIAGCDMTFNQSCYGLRGTDSAGDYFVYLTAQQMVDQLKSMAHGSVFSTITRQTFEAIQRPISPPAVLAAFERLVTGSFDSILSSAEESRTLAHLRDTLLPKLISGELRIADAERFLETRS